jgi:hypothetical protein
LTANAVAAAANASTRHDGAIVLGARQARARLPWDMQMANGVVAALNTINGKVVAVRTQDAAVAWAVGGLVLGA